jgi:hypothetical protein
LIFWPSRAITTANSSADRRWRGSTDDVDMG